MPLQVAVTVLIGQQAACAAADCVALQARAPVQFISEPPGR